MCILHEHREKYMQIDKQTTAGPKWYMSTKKTKENERQNGGIYLGKFMRYSDVWLAVHGSISVPTIPATSFLLRSSRK